MAQTTETTMPSTLQVSRHPSAGSRAAVTGAAARRGSVPIATSKPAMSADHDHHDHHQKQLHHPAPPDRSI